jgi:hypothetical protein
MISQLLVVLLPILGVIIGALLAGFFLIVNSYLQTTAVDERERKKLILGKLEELFDIIELVRVEHKNSLLTFHRYLIQTEEVPIAMPPEEKSQAVKILALVNFYAPELNPKLSQLVEDLSAFPGFQTEVGLFLQSGSNNKEEIARITDNGKAYMRKINESCLEMQREISVIAKKYI